MTTGAQEVTTVDELQLRFVGGVVGGLWPSGVVHCEGMPDDHWSSRGDDRERASTSFVEDSPGL